MSNLDAFLHPVQEQETKEVIISNRFQTVNADGKTAPAPFVIRAISEEENQKIRRMCTRRFKDRSGMTATEFDTSAYSVRMVLAGTVTPDFSAAEMCEAYKTKDPMEVPGRMLKAGEYNRLSDAIAEFSGFDDDIEEQAKN